MTKVGVKRRLGGIEAGLGGVKGLGRVEGLGGLGGTEGLGGLGGTEGLGGEGEKD